MLPYTLFDFVFFINLFSLSGNNLSIQSGSQLKNKKIHTKTDCTGFTLGPYLLFISCSNMTEVFAGLPEQDILLTEFFLEKFLWRRTV